MIRKLSGHQYAQTRVEINDNGSVCLYSYKTLVIVANPIGDGKYEISCSGLYSATTRTHIGWFLKEYFPTVSYTEIRDLAYNATIIAERRG